MLVELGPMPAHLTVQLAWSGEVLEAVAQPLAETVVERGMVILDPQAELLIKPETAPYGLRPGENPPRRGSQG